MKRKRKDPGSAANVPIASNPQAEADRQRQPSGFQWDSRAFRLAAPLLIALAICAAYANCFSVPFLLDDRESIVENVTIRNLWNVKAALTPPQGGITVAGRPLLNLSFALNYAAGKTQVWGYHAFNVGCHILVALLLYCVLARTLSGPRLRDRFGSAAQKTAFCIALVWALHPLQTESVTYIVQRAESLVSFFYLLTFYCFIRSLSGARVMPWRAACIAACALGMASKEVMVSAPLMILFYDRTFGAGSFRGALRQRRFFYAGLFGTWLLLAALIMGTGGRGGTVGFDSFPPIKYLAAQCWAIPHYLKLVYLPHPLIFDYGIELNLIDELILAGAALLLALAAGAVVLLIRKPALGFPCLCFFALLAPSSSFIPIKSEIVSEHRMYLPLAIVLSLTVFALQARIGRKAYIICLVWAALLGAATHARNATYATALSIWEDTVQKYPHNARAYDNIGHIYFEQGQYAKAADAFAQSIAVNPKLPKSEAGLARALVRLNRSEEAWPHYQAALSLDPTFYEAMNDYGGALSNAGLYDQALPILENAVRIKPDFAVAHFNYALTLDAVGREQDAIVQYRETLKLDHGFARAERNLGFSLLHEKQFDEAIVHFTNAIALDANPADAEFGLGTALAATGRADEARTHFQNALRLRPDFTEAQAALDALQKPAP